MSNARSALDMFVSHNKSVLDGMSESSDVGRYRSQLDSLRAALEGISASSGAARDMKVKKAEEVALKTKEVQALEERVRTEGKERVERLRFEEGREKSMLESCREARLKSTEGSKRAIDLLTKSIVSYREGLSLEFERAAGNRLRLVFTSLDKSNPERPFAFTINVDDNEMYQVEECKPALPREEIDGMVREVNVSNDFGGFVRGVRKLFKERV